MNTITYVEGILTDIQPVGRQIIVNVCNEVGIWAGDGANRIAKRWPYARTAYLNWYRNRIRNDFTLGAVQFVRADNRALNHRAFVANLVAQTNASRPIRYRAFEKGLLRIRHKARRWGASVHLQSPTIIQSDSWPDLEDIIVRTLCVSEVRVYIYLRITTDEPQQAATREFKSRLRCSRDGNKRWR